MNYRIGFGYHENFVGHHVCFPTENMKGLCPMLRYTRELSIRAVSIVDTKQARRWLHTLNEYVTEGKINISNSDESEISYITKGTVNMEFDYSNIEVGSAESDVKSLMMQTNYVESNVKQ